MLLSLVVPASALGRKPTKTESAKQKANESLDTVEKGVKKALKETKKAGNEVLGKVDQGVHKVVGTANGK